MSENNIRNLIRTATLGTGADRASTIMPINGQDVEVRQPTVGQRSRILTAAGGGTTGEIKDFSKLQIAAIMHCCYVPNTEEHIFEKADEATLMNMPSGGWVDELAAEAVRLMNTEAEQDAKN